MSNELKPCPFCGGEAWIDRDSCGWNKVKANHSDNCPLLGNNMLTWSSGSDVPMVGKWNTRALTPKQQCADEMYAMIEKMVMDIEEDMFESWLDKNSPSGDSECVDRQWRDSYDYLHFLSEFKDELSLLAKARGEA